MKIAILGAGAWGSALAIAWSGSHEVALWTRSAPDIDELRRSRRSRYLPEAGLPESVRIVASLAQAVAGADLLLVATPTAGLRETAAAASSAAPGTPLIWACKGFEKSTAQLPHEIVAEVLLRGGVPVGALSGPSFALEVARGLPTAVVLASVDREFSTSTAAKLNSPRLRIYSSADVVGVELGGAVKNVIAIAAGICDGLELGRNARAALVTRGLAEIVRLGVAEHGQAETFMGLAGLGDLVLTCTGDLSRNRTVGLELARGRPLASILERLGHVAEGVQSTAPLLDRARRARVEMPISAAVGQILAGVVSPARAVEHLLARDPRPE